MKSFLIASGIGLFAVSFLGAQETPRFTFNLGAGFTTPAGTTGSYLDTGWNVRGGFGINFNSHIGANIDVGFDHMGINSATLASFGAPGGSADVLSATLDPIVHLTPHSHVDFYITGGGGEFRWYQNFTAPTVATVGFYNPFFGFGTAAVPATQILSSYSVNKPGIDLGAGLAFGGINGHGKFFAEARWDHIYMTNSHVDYIPVTFGFRW